MRLGIWLLAWSVAAATTVPVATARATQDSEPQIAGTYRTVSESEWELEIDLREDGSLRVELASWPAEEPTRVSIEVHEGRWRLRGTKVKIFYGGRTERLRFHPALSLDELGLAGTAPGLRGLSDDRQEDLFAGQSLWLTEELREHLPPD